MISSYLPICVFVLMGSLTVVRAADKPNFTVEADSAVKFGVHEIVLTGTSSPSNPFDVVATVTFTPPSGTRQARTVDAFYDGGDVWRARVYVSEIGKWSWSSTCKTDRGLNQGNRT